MLFYIYIEIDTLHMMGQARKLRDLGTHYRWCI